MCQLLLVDPSAWSRWMRDETKVPPHIFRALEWYLALHHKRRTDPDLNRYFLAKYSGFTGQNSNENWRREIEALKRQLLWAQILAGSAIGGFAGLVSFWLLSK